MAKKPPDFDKALEKYQDFYDFDPRRAGIMNVVIPGYGYYVGAVINTRYESDKWELSNPKKKHGYTHEHGRGVSLYVPSKRGERGDTQIPDYIRSAKTLVKLGNFLGLDFINQGDAEEVPPARSDELYTIPSGKALMVISGKRTLKCLIWGGALDVRSTGIVY